VFTLASLTAIVALSIDMSLPAQPTLARTFGVSAETSSLNLSLFMIAFAAAQVFVGYISDAIGRRRVMFGGLAVFTLAAIACTASPSMEVLLACRVLQGAGAACAPVVARAMIRDTQPAQQAARFLSTMLATLAIAPMIAPTIGTLLLDAIGWRAIFGALATCGLLLLAYSHLTLVETLPVERRRPATIAGLFDGYRRFFGTRGTRIPILISCAAFAGQFAYIAVSPFVLMEGYHVPRSQYGVYFGVTAFALMLGSLTGRAMLGAGRPPRTMIVVGASILLAGSVFVAIGTRVGVSPDGHGGLGLPGFIVPMLVYFFGTGITSPSATALAMEPVPQLAGTASSAIGCLTMVSGSVAGYETARIGGSSPKTFALVVTVMGTLAFALAIVLRLGQKQQESR
jgi:DHA1 family bicyclomycin/chloramphenicol resistance-like MFS transporter